MRSLILIASLLGAGVALTAKPVDLNEESFDASSGEHGVILFEVNWGRRWNCAGADNAQLNRFSPYALLIEPGEYALTGFDVKIAWSMTDIVHAVWNAEKAGYAGTFTVAPGEFVYIGHFGLDCSSEPIPWRYYIEGADEFDRYVEGFRERFPFVGEVTVEFRLFQSTLFGTEYSLFDGTE